VALQLNASGSWLKWKNASSSWLDTQEPKFVIQETVFSGEKLTISRTITYGRGWWLMVVLGRCFSNLQGASTVHRLRLQNRSKLLHRTHFTETIFISFNKTPNRRTRKN
jgi:hypothetical protein